MKLSDRKQLLQIIAEELNIKQLSFTICDSNKGKIKLVYTASDALNKIKSRLEIFVGEELKETSESFKNKILEDIFQIIRSDK